MKFEEIIEEMENMLESSWKLPMSGGKTVVDASEMERLISELKNTIPNEIAEAHSIVENKQRMIQDAKSKCEEIYKVAKKKVESMVENDEIVKSAKNREVQLMKECKDKTKNLVSNTYENLKTYLDEYEKSMLKVLNEVRKSKSNLNSLMSSMASK